MARPLPAAARSVARRFAAASLAVFLAAGCSPAYLIKQGAGQVGLLLARRPISEALSDPAIPEPTKTKLRLVGEVRLWGEREIGLAHTHSYETWVDTCGQPVSWLVTACPPDSLTPESWWFPIVGSVPYRGYFSKEDALLEKKRLRRRGFDVHVRTVTAYSTLGFFNDPVTSCFLQGEIYDVADTILHETTHATVWIPGSVEFNESLANFVGEEGALRWLREKFGPDSAEVRAALTSRRGRALFRQLVEELRADLTRIFALKLHEVETAALKAGAFERHRQRIEASPLTDKGRRRLAALPWNNALVAGYSVYHGDDDLWPRLLAATNGSLREFVEAVKDAAKEGDPRAAIERRIATAGAASK